MSTAGDLIAEVRKDLFDLNAVRYSDSDLIAYLNDAALAVTIVRPDATSVVSVVPLTTGSKQQIPSDGSRLLYVQRNMGDSGSEPGPAILFADRAAMNAGYPDWMSEAGDTIYNYIFDEKTPRDFWVYPAVDAGASVFVEIAYSAAPAAVAALTDPMPLADVYRPAMHEWMLYRAWGGDNDDPTKFSRAQAKLQSFSTILGVKIQGERLVTPATIKSA